MTSRATDSTRTRPDWSAGIGAGLVAGLFFLILEMLMVPLFLGGSPWDPPRMIAAIALGEGVLPMPGRMPPPLDARVMLTALIVHFSLSALYGLMLAWLIAGVNAGAAAALGIVFGLALYFVNFYGFTAVFPWFAMARNWISIFSHVIFGLAGALAYKAISGRAPARLT